MTSAKHRCFPLLMAKYWFTSLMTSHYDRSHLRCDNTGRDATGVVLLEIVVLSPIFVPYSSSNSTCILTPIIHLLSFMPESPTLQCYRANRIFADSAEPIYKHAKILATMYGGPHFSFLTHAHTRARRYVAYLFYFWRIRTYANVFYLSVRKQEQNTLQLQHSSLIINGSPTKGHGTKGHRTKGHKTKGHWDKRPWDKRPQNITSILS